MNPKTIMVVAGDPSGDAIAADLVRALAATLPAARFIGAGGPRMAEAGVANSFDLTADAVIGLSDVLQKLPRFGRYKRELTRLAATQKPDVVILVDFSYFNQRLARAIRRLASPDWRLKLVKYVSPQVWASRPGRAADMARDFDLLLCLFPFEKDWYARHVPDFRVEFVGHPMFDRYPAPVRKQTEIPTVLLLPGSRRAELKRHLPVILGAARLIATKQAARFKLVAPSENMAALVGAIPVGAGPEIEIQIGHLEDALSEATLAIASTGTVTLECAYFGVPTVALYKTSLQTYWIARQVVTVKYLSMPNILADEPIFPEFIQHEATAKNIAGAALELLANPGRRTEIQSKLARVISTLGGPGAAGRAAAAILKLATAENGKATV
ncbi:MAG TPA: lipid-A-disaccharide synthase [Verrucomicrobiae bacterium]|jgi:lipid-A-disaccharide synthase|nr:lipid-A-disaccharide synthase [Verrucomicrobiae bacterium]